MIMPLRRKRERVQKLTVKCCKKKIENLLSMLPKQIHLVTIIYKRIVPNVSSMFEKHWHVLQVNSKFKIFRESHHSLA